MGNNKVSSKRGSGGSSGGKKDKFSSLAGKWKFIIILGIICTGTVVGFGIYLGANYLSTHGIGPGATPTLTASTFAGISAVDGEDVSDFVEGSIWVPKSSVTFDDSEDIYTLTNFEETKSSMDLNDISIDLRNIPYAWLEIDPDGESVFSNEYYLLIGGKNYAYTKYVHDLTTDVNFNIMDEDTMAVITVGDLTTSGGYVAVFNAPPDTETAAQLHVGTNWDMEQSDFDELSATQKAVYYDEANWAGQYPLYDPTVDTSKEYYRDLEKLTNAFALKFTFNTTISTVDGDPNQVNVTVASGQPVDVVISGTIMYFIWYEGFDFSNGAVPLYFDMTCYSGVDADAIGLDNVQSGRLVVPADSISLGAFTAYSAIGA